MCDSRSGRHNVNRWWNGGDCAVSAYSENDAVWGEVRLGRRGVGANTYTAVVVVGSVVGGVASAVPTGRCGVSVESRACDLWGGFASACGIVASDGHWIGRGLPDGFALGEGVSVCGLGGVEDKFLKAMVEKHPLLWARAPGATPNRGQLQRPPWNHPSKHRCTTRVPQTGLSSCNQRPIQSA